jgi:hypothetical protein
MAREGFLWVALDMLDDHERRLEGLFTLASFFSDEVVSAPLGVSLEERSELAEHTLDQVMTYAIGIMNSTGCGPAVFATRLTDSLIPAVPVHRAADAALVAGRFARLGPGSHDALDFETWIYSDILYMTEAAIKLLDGDTRHEQENRAVVILHEARRISQKFEERNGEAVGLVYLADAILRLEAGGSAQATAQAGEILVEADRTVESWRAVSAEVRQRFNELCAIAGIGRDEEGALG